jgi:hypothetical protein
LNCYVHNHTPAVGICCVCQKAVCRECVGRDTPRLACKTCVEQSRVLGFEYRSAAAVGSLPFVHVCLGIDPITMRPRVAKGIVAIGNIAVGVVTIAGVSLGVLSLGGVSLGVLFALGGVALGVGVSAGGVAVGSVAVGGVAIGFLHAIGGLALGPSIIDGRRCDPDAAEFVRRWLGSELVPRNCR